MNDESITSLIDYLLKRQFGSLAPPPPPTLGNPASFRSAAVADASYKRIQVARAEYQAMPAEEIRTKAEAARREDAEAREAKLKKEAAELFFNLPNATADLAYFAKMATWSLDEAVALSLGKVPSVVNRNSMEGERYMPAAWHHSPFPREYARRSELVRRAGSAYELNDPTTPADFLAWAKHLDLSLPPELESEVEKRTPMVDLRRELEVAQTRIADLERELVGMREANSSRWPWGTYETRWLRQLDKAVKRFWLGYVPTDPSTANTNATVSAWLQGQGVPQRVAEVMAQIIRADGLRPGPR